MAKERLQKLLARAGVASRRAAEKLIESGRVRVNGAIVTELGSKADLRADKVELDGRKLLAENLVYAVLHKPRGVVSTLYDPEGRATVKELVAGIPVRVFPVGRLDFATSGVLLLTNDGDLSDTLLHPRKSVPKTYAVKVNGKMSEKDAERWRAGVRLDDGITKPAKLEKMRHEEDKTWFELTLSEGRNQQIRRMGEATGFRVMRLARLSFAKITSEKLPPGKWRYLTRDELMTLRDEYGVPKRIVSPPEPSVRTPRDGRKRPPAPKKERPVREFSGEKRSQERTHGPRYGGGSPVRRDTEVTEDWGGGSHRGRLPARPASIPPPGRGGRTRTTGTGGGVGAGEGSYRLWKGRRG